ncbi:MAG: type IV pilus assembly protein PilM [Patescibacteria group bacterium]|nr:type IV pilus assembly protein PilM [Patescibacteria group bacterium]
MRDFFAQNQNFDSFGLDISETSLRFAKVKRTKNVCELVSYGFCEIPPGIVRQGEIIKGDVLAGLIKDGLAKVRGKKIKSRFVVADLPEEKSFLDILTVPTVDGAALDRAVQVEAESHIPVPLNDVYFDFAKIGAVSASAQEVLFVAVPKKTVDDCLAVLKMAGLQPVAMEPESIALNRAIFPENGSREPVLVVDIGKNSSRAIITAGGRVRFTSNLPITSLDMTKALMKNLNLSEQPADELKIKEGLVGKNEVREALIPVLTDLAEQIKMHLDYYRSHNMPFGAEKTINQIVLCGGGAELSGFVDFLSQTLGKKVSLANPWAKIAKMARRSIIFKTSHALGAVTVFGLALRNFYEY